MISIENISTLYSASEINDIAATAITEQERASVARAINKNANTGEVKTEWIGSLSEAMLLELESKGYIVSKKRAEDNKDIQDFYIISSR